MEFLQTKEFYVTQAEATIKLLKENNFAWDAKLSIKALAACVDKQAEDYQVVYDWLLNLLRKEELQPVEHLNTEQARYGNYLIQAVYDSVTMVI